MKTAAQLRIIWAIAVFTPVLLSAAGTNWMAALDGRLLLSQLTIPGSHDSCALHEQWGDTAVCQRASIAQQLDFGVRLLDIRCRHVRDRFAIYHGSVSQRQTFADVLEQTAAFLKKNPSECVLMSVKEEHTALDNSRSFEATFNSYVATNAALWWSGTNVPTLDSVRGKIVLLRRFHAAGDKGINASAWPDNTVFSVNQISIQDCYRVADNAAKWLQVSNALASAAAETNAGVLHLNFASGYKSGMFGVPSISSVSSDINPRLAAFFSGALRGHYGCVLMDFEGAQLVRLIYNSNFGGGQPSSVPASHHKINKP